MPACLLESLGHTHTHIFGPWSLPSLPHTSAWNHGTRTHMFTVWVRAPGYCLTCPVQLPACTHACGYTHTHTHTHRTLCFCWAKSRQTCLSLGLDTLASGLSLSLPFAPSYASFWFSRPFQRWARGAGHHAVWQIPTREARCLRIPLRWWAGDSVHGSAAWLPDWARDSGSRTGVGRAPGEPGSPVWPTPEAQAPVTPDLCAELMHILSLLVILPPCDAKPQGDGHLGWLPPQDPAFPTWPWQPPRALTSSELVPWGTRCWSVNSRLLSCHPAQLRTPQWAACSP